jgi:Family of unknown function (DUF5995)
MGTDLEDGPGRLGPGLAETPSPIEAVGQRLRERLGRLPPDDANRHFVAMYLRTTEAMKEALVGGRFADPLWVERWDAAFARLYLDALDASNQGTEPRPWAIAFETARRRPQLPPLRHVLLGINAHINYDLPQALLAVMTDHEFADPAIRRLRERDHRAVDEVLAARVAAEDAELLAASGGRNVLDRALAPLNRIGTRHFLREARGKVWANAIELSRARHAGGTELTGRVEELASISAAKLEQLTAPGQVLLKLAVFGFGVRLRPSYQRSRVRSFDPERVGLLERDAWVAYYQHRWFRVLWTSVVLVQSGFHLGAVPTLRGAWHVLRANQMWAPVPDNDPDGAVGQMTRFYRLVRDYGGEPIDPEIAAALEVDWWRVHRSLQRPGAGGGSSVADLEAALARLYAYLYSVGEDAVRLAAQERARAMVISDRWVADGCDPQSPELAAESEALVRSYAALLAAVWR